jgi:type II secretory pathway component GspD/PulD (secretin)
MFRATLLSLMCAVALSALPQEALSPAQRQTSPSPSAPRLRVVLEQEPFAVKLREIIEAQGLRLEIIGRSERNLSTVLDGETVEEIIRDLASHAGHLIVRRGDTVIVYAEGAAEIVGAEHVTYTYGLRGMQAETALEQLQNLRLGGLHVAMVKSLNSLLLRGPLPVVNDARRFLETIDRTIPNVMIELLVVEYFHGDEFHWGFDILQGTKSQFSDVTVAPGLGRLAGTYSLVANLPKSFKFNITALVLDRSAKVVTNPHLSVRNSDRGMIRLDETQNLIVTNPTDLSGTTRTLQPITSSVVLEITPLILDDQRIQMAVRGEVGVFIPSETPDGVPGIETNKVESSVTVGNAETLILGGLIKEEDITIDSGVPYLRRIPLLGYLFKEREKRRFYTETVIYITPRIADQRFFEEPFIEQDVRERLEHLEQRDKKFKKRGW